MKRLLLTAILAAACLSGCASASHHTAAIYAAKHHATHGIGTAVLKYNWRGGHAVAP